MSPEERREKRVETRLFNSTRHDALVKLAGLRAKGFRNLSGFIPLHRGLAVVVGENNVGKSNLVDACRLLFEPEVGPAGRLWITVGDFAHDGHGNRLANSFELEAVFTELSESERARMVTCLAPSMGSDCARITLRASLSGTTRVHTEWLGGDSSHPDVEPFAREAVSFTYLHPLRDAATDLRPGRTNRLVSLLGSLAPDGHPDRVAVESIMNSANLELSDVPSVATARDRIQRRMSELTGAGRLGQVSDLVFAEPRFEKVLTTLRALVGSIGPVEVYESGLGYSNLLYMSVLLSALEEPTDALLRILLIEEPEAHLHPQLQDLLMRFLETTGESDSQVVVTTHSPNLASGARVERLTVLSRSHTQDALVARCIGDFALEPHYLDHLRRFLDVTKSALLFSRGVILVEGLAEQLLVPVMAEVLGMSLAQEGITVVNVDGLAFRPFLELFGPDKLPFPCAVISDSDPPDHAVDVDESTDDSACRVGDDGSPGRADELAATSQLRDATPGPSSQDLSEAPTQTHTTGAASETPSVSDESAAAKLSATAQSLKALESNHLGVFLAKKTLEWDLVEAGNWDVLLEALRCVKPLVSRRLEREHGDSTWDTRADAFLAKVRDSKGRFAQELAAIMGGTATQFKVPSHIEEAIAWASRAPSSEQSSQVDPDPGFAAVTGANAPDYSE